MTDSVNMKQVADDAANQLIGEVVTWLNENDDWLKQRFEEVFPLHPIYAACKNDEDARTKAYDLCKDFFVGGAMAAVSRMKEPATKEDMLAQAAKAHLGNVDVHVSEAHVFNGSDDLPQLDPKHTNAVLLDQRTGELVTLHADSPEELREKVKAKVAQINADFAAKVN